MSVGQTARDHILCIGKDLSEIETAESIHTYLHFIV